MRSDVRVNVQPLILKKVKIDDLDPKWFSVAILMENKSMERRNKINHIEIILIINEDLTKEIPKSEVKRKLSFTNDKLVGRARKASVYIINSSFRLGI